MDYCIEKWINVKVVDFPFCTIKDKKYIERTDEYCYAHRMKQTLWWGIEDRNTLLPRGRSKIEQCKSCSYKDICWWVLHAYVAVYGTEEIVPFI